MDYLKKELNKLLPMALLFGAAGGVLLIILGNVFSTSPWAFILTYACVITASVYVLNHMRYKKEITSSVLYGYCVFAVMTAIAWLDVMLNANPNFSSPVFQLGVFVILVVGVFLIGASIPALFKRRLI